MLLKNLYKNHHALLRMPDIELLVREEASDNLVRLLLLYFEARCHYFLEKTKRFMRIMLSKLINGLIFLFFNLFLVVLCFLFNVVY